MTTPKPDGAGPKQCPPEELLLKKCGCIPCENIAAFRDGKGYWWCYFHRDYKGDWGIDEFPSYTETLKGIRNLLASERAEAEKKIEDLEMCIASLKQEDFFGET